ncbi:hypothetical protein VNI00_010591 [Paramarasmius palmivorus]|uniref:Fungal lipase-type domain-containing protein n=1 Tax=Paramarasmius palmivorus TaxID=297713 RepID=A0AAW0CIK9_9AGAR
MMSFDLLRFSVAVLAFLASGVVASPAAVKRQSITALSAAQISAFKPYSFYASTAYCKPANTLAWNCGANCQANPTFKPIASGGDGGSIQFWYVGYDPALKTVIVGHQGTDFSKIEAALTDADIILESLDSTLFPGVPSGVKVHSGFKDEHAKTAATILSNVQKALTQNSATSVTVVGHSLGAALALLDSIYLPLHLPAGTTVKMIGYGMPRVGNSSFATYVDSHATVTHINNKQDIVPILPGRFLGFAHPNGEVHITDSNVWDSCPGHDNTDDRCTVGDVPNIFVGDTGDHKGPYDGVTMGC